MNTNNSTGRSIACGIGAYAVGKAILNGIVGAFSVKDILIGAVMAVFLYCGFKFTNYIIAAVLAVIALIHLPDNISNIGSNWLYLLEGIIDICCAVTLCTNPAVKQHFTNGVG